MFTRKGVDIALFLTGLAAGAAAGVLWAPRSGKETRAAINGWLQAEREKGTALLNEIKKEGLHRTEQITAAIKAGKEAYQHAATRS
ncbi:MAG: YtxH domain-containing protein [Elusimicrobiota bacterium]|jgi:gas vesicle protein